MATLKNTTISGTGSITLPSGTTAQRPASPATGQLRYNSSITMLERYDGTRWAYSPPVITDGLVCWLDAAEPSSYSGSGSTWTDLSGNGNSVTLYNTPTYSTNNGGILQFAAASNQYGTKTPLNYSTGTSTVVAGSRYSGGTRGRTITSYTNNWLLGHWNSTVANFYSEGWVTGSGTGAGGNDTTWRIYAGTSNVTSDLYGFYVNGSLNAGINIGGAAGINGLSIGGTFYSGSLTEKSDCEVSFVLVYNRILAPTEIIQLYNAYRGRFGI